MAQLTLILGGAKSGKTALALKQGQDYSAPRVYLATAEAGDKEMAERICRHQTERGPGWHTIEEPWEPDRVISQNLPERSSVVLMDCLTLWLSNLMAGKGLSIDDTVRRTMELTEACLLAPCPIIVVSNEVGWGIVPENKLARDFRDAAGRAHQILARSASTVYMAVAGLPWKIKGSAP